MTKETCNLNCSKLVETFASHIIEKQSRKMTHMIYETRHKVHKDDVLVLRIVKMQMVYLHHVWSELLCLQKCDVEILLDNLASESELIFVLSHALQPTTVTIKGITMANINSQFPAAAKELIEKYIEALNNANIPTKVVKELEPYIEPEEEKHIQLIQSPSGSVAALGHFAKPAASPVSTPVPAIHRVTV
jgi:hypothetical protein